ncbi:MAG: TlyA family RNA methyltransferase [Metamycoplasmataceae bacterium]
MKKTIKELLKTTYQLDDKKIESLFLAKSIFYKNEIVLNLNLKIDENDKLEFEKEKNYISRGAYKLLEAIEKFNISIQDLICLDIGSSTGGFTQILLEKGAKKIYALDVGTNQLDYSLRINPKILSIEKTNLKTINPGMFEEEIDFICCDVSFISLRRVFDVIKNVLKRNHFFIALIKPQFEASKNKVEIGGIVKQEYHPQIIDNLIEYSKNDFDFIGIIESPIKGNKAKNIEYLALFKKK